MLFAYYSDHVALPLPEKHAFPRNKYALTRQRVTAFAAELSIELRPAPPATDAELLRVHTAEYVRRVRSGTLTEVEQREIGFPWSEGFVQRSLHSNGATLAAGRAVFAERDAGRDAWGCHLAGGTHHAFPDRGQGFCVFNDMAVAVRNLRAEGRFERALVLDLDVHQGNGTAAIFADDPMTFTVSLHGGKNYPRLKETSDLDVPLPDACEDAEYLGRLDETLAETWRRFDPQAVFYIAGADPYEHDRYGRMKLTMAGLRERDERVAAACRERGLPVVAAMGGGYARDVDAVAAIYATTVEVLARYAPPSGARVCD
ncbi:Acetoin utilization protein AcuC [Botrimarina colliarenosi]|uniref:Acetoin utilization protein AcuC n=1 Tax=Botrimarina colliarenosi TaxID=2528001 RepID=A0A5C6AB61_9BACT|nr:histone deacetylase [Botrimarina colliarenosi]TWT96597.1 Acetoin utilization protein AcuC [Botrimarina colliarenosi]